MEKEEKKLKENVSYEYPSLQRVFAYLDRKIKYYRRSDNEESKQELIENREKLFRIAQEIDLRDLWILYYIRFTPSLGRAKMLKNLKELYEAQARFKEELLNS